MKAQESCAFVSELNFRSPMRARARCTCTRLRAPTWKRPRRR